MRCGLLEQLQEIPDQFFWNVRQSIKTEVLKSLRQRLQEQCTRKGLSAAHFQRLTRWLNPADPNVLTIGFARRFATYKRATLLFNDLARLANLVGNPERPVVFLFAGKAHPADEPARKLLREIKQLMRAASSSAAWSSSKTTTCSSRAGSWPASTSGSTIRSHRSRRAALPASRPRSTAR